ncbi:MAG: STN domain-containing protein [Desulfobulbaceae bacterium]|nr:STN domain-containing protein [Desulfobulbaceae bacterium]
MIRSLLLTVLLGFGIVTLQHFPAYGTVNDGLKKTPVSFPVSLEMHNRPVREILDVIETQTKYTIEILNLLKAEDLDEILNNKKSIVLNEATLDQALNRLLKDYNYSILSNDNLKTLTLVLLNKENSSYAVSPGGEAGGVAGDESGESRGVSMDSVTAAFEEYNNNTGPSQSTDDLQEQEETSMDGVTIAFEEFESNKGTQPAEDDLQEQEETSMDGATAAFEEFANNKNKGTPQVTDDDSPGQEETSMDAVTIAFEEFKNNTGGQSLTDQETEATSMDGVIIAFEEYRRLNDEKNN